MPYTKKQHAWAGAQLGKRRKGQPDDAEGMTTAQLEHMASKASGTRKKKAKPKAKR